MCEPHETVVFPKLNKTEREGEREKEREKEEKKIFKRFRQSKLIVLKKLRIL